MVLGDPLKEIHVRYLRNIIVILAGSLMLLGTAHAQVDTEKAKDAPPTEIVDCNSLPSLGGLLNTPGPRARCRIEFEDLVCLPGSTLARDVKQDRDLCLNQKKKPIQVPRCAGRKREKYTQRLVERAYYPVDYANGNTQVELLDIPFTTVSRKDLLARAEPILRPGPDGCVYFRRELIMMGRQGEQR